MTKNNTVIERFRMFWGFAPEGSLKYKKGKDLEAFLTEELERRDKEILEKIEGMKITQDELYVKMDKETKAYNQALKDIEQMIERK